MIHNMSDNVESVVEVSPATVAAADSAAGSQAKPNAAGHSGDKSEKTEAGGKAQVSTGVKYLIWQLEGKEKLPVFRSPDERVLYDKMTKVKHIAEVLAENMDLIDRAKVIVDSGCSMAAGPAPRSKIQKELVAFAEHLEARLRSNVKRLRDVPLAWIWSFILMNAFSMLMFRCVCVCVFAVLSFSISSSHHACMLCTPKPCTLPLHMRQMQSRVG